MRKSSSHARGGAPLVLAITVLMTAWLGSPARAEAKKRVLYVGDSIAAETVDLVKSTLDDTGRAVTSYSVRGGSAICDYLSGETQRWLVKAENTLRRRVASDRPDLVILQFWGNSWQFTPCMNGYASGTTAYYLKYWTDAYAAIEDIRAGAADASIAMPKVLWVLQGPNQGDPARSASLNQFYTYVAGGDSKVYTVDAGREVSQAANPFFSGDGRYEWTRFLPCRSDERNTPFCTEPQAFGGVTRLHKDSDATHFCLGEQVSASGKNATGEPRTRCDPDKPSPGIRRYGLAIAGRAKDLLGI